MTIVDAGVIADLKEVRKSLEKLIYVLRRLDVSPSTAAVAPTAVSSITPSLAPTASPELLTPISRSQAYLMLSTGEIPSIKIGRCRRIRRSDLNRWLGSA